MASHRLFRVLLIGLAIVAAASLEAVVDLGSWSPKTPMAAPRGGTNGATVNGVLYVPGGCIDGLGYIATNQAYNPATNTWTAKEPMPTGRCQPVVAEIDGLIYVAG